MRTVEWFLLCLVFCGSMFGFGADLKSAGGITLAADYSFFLKSGSADDYEVGVNEFPIEDPHSVSGISVGYLFNPLGKRSIGFEAAYNLKSKKVINDPSDNDTAEVDTLPSLEIHFIVTERLIRGKKYSLFTEFGLGIFYFLDASGIKTYTTTIGYKLELDPPDKLLGYSGFLGIGNSFTLSPKLAIIISARFKMHLSDVVNSAISAHAGVRIFI